MKNNKFCIHLKDGNITRNILAKSISHTTATNLYNQLTKPPFNVNSHDFKCHDSFSILNNEIRLIMFLGNKIDMVVYVDGRIKKLTGNYEYIGNLKPLPTEQILF